MSPGSFDPGGDGKMGCVNKECDFYNEKSTGNCRAELNKDECHDLITEKASGSKVPCSDGVIKPCPFCGEGNWKPKIMQTGKYAYHVECPCGGRGATYSGSYSALEQWNKRAL